MIVISATAAIGTSVALAVAVVGAVEAVAVAAAASTTVTRQTLSWLDFVNEDLRRLSMLTWTASTFVADRTNTGETGP